MSKWEYGHGHVVPRRDGVRVRCGGPGICAVCSKELAEAQAESHFYWADLKRAREAHLQDVLENGT